MSRLSELKFETFDLNAGLVGMQVTSDDEQLVLDFKEKFGITAEIDVIRKLLGRPQVKPWYTKWRAERAKAKAVPAQYASLGMTPDEWQEALQVAQQRSNLRKDAQVRIDQARLRYESEMTKANAELAKKLAETPSKFADIYELNITDLPLVKQLEIEREPSVEKRQELATRHLNQLRAERLDQARSKRGDARQ
jgi:hypothetical protein